MLLDNTLEIYPSSRAIRERISRSLHDNILLPKLITIGEFEKKALIIPGRTFPDEDTRILLMQEASDFANFKALQIDREFFTFLKNSKYLFAFFEELAVEMVHISTLAQHDTYADYDEHLRILEQLRENYTALLEKHGYVDKITLPEHYRLNKRYIDSFSRIDLFLEGYLNRFEWQLFRQIAQIVPVHLHIHTNAFNRKMTDLFVQYGLKLEENRSYIIDLATMSIVHETVTLKNETHYDIQAQKSTLEEIAFVKKKIFDYIEQGYDPEEIAVILPKPANAELLDLFDEENNFNFAMGFPFTQTTIYRYLESLYLYFHEKSYENLYRLLAQGFDKSRIDTLISDWNGRFSPETIFDKLDTLIPENESSQEALQHYKSQLQLFKKLLPTLKHYPFHKIFHLFLNRLAKLRIDDTRGGKVTVMEILETRGIQKACVIVIDFNEGVLPAPSKKDLFLSTAIRSAAGMPTPKDRENLQKYYYFRLFQNAKEVAVSFVLDEQNQPSRFLDELALTYDNGDSIDLGPILFPVRTTLPHYRQTDLVLEYDFTKQPLSVSALKTFLECKRKYYFQYIRKLEDFEIPKEEDDERVVGTHLHEALKSVYDKYDHYNDEEALLLDLQRELYLRSEQNLSLRFVIDKWLEMLKPFIAYEVSRFGERYRVFATEKRFETTFGALHLIGTIDRIDRRDDYYFIIDYKSGKIPESNPKKLENESNFQLQFYHLLAHTVGEIKEAFYYDLKNAALVNEPLFDEKLALLYTHLETLEQTKTFNFTMTEEQQKCKWCPYAKICDRIQ